MEYSKAHSNHPNDLLNYSDAQKQSHTLFIGGVSVFCHELDLFQAFNVFGPIESIKLMRNKQNDALGYAFLTFLNYESSISALQMNGQLFQGRPIK